MNIGGFLTQAARHHADQTALVSGSRRLTYRQLEARVSALAAGLQQRGFRQGDRCAVYMNNRPEFIESMFAVWIAGGVVVPLNAKFQAPEVAHHLEDSQASFVLSDEAHSAVLGDLAGVLPAGGRTVLVGGDDEYEALLREHADAQPHRLPVGDDDLAWLFYTSGTTGRSKGAMLTHGVLTFVTLGYLADVMPVRPGDVGLHATPLTHAAGIHALALTLRGATQVLMGGGFNPAAFLDAVEEHRVNHVWLVPTQVKMLLDRADLESRDLTSLRRLVYGGAPMHAEHLKAALRRLGPVLTQIWGQAETPMTGTCLTPEDHLLDGSAEQMLASCGRVRSGIELRIVDEQDRPVKPGEKGELCIRGASVMSGYWRQPEATAEAIRDGWLHTGDVGSVDARGFVTILDRTRDMVITGGMNVYPREVEEVLVQHPAVSEACVFGLPDEHWGEQVTAAVVLQPQARLDEAELMRFLSKRLSGFKKPKVVHFVSELPKSAYGKVLKRELASALTPVRGTRTEAVS